MASSLPLAAPPMGSAPKGIVVPTAAEVAAVSGGNAAFDLAAQASFCDRNLFATYLDLKERLDRSFVNETPMLTCGSKPFTINDVVAAAVLSGSNLYLIGSRGSGKTLLAETLQRSVFGDVGLYLRGDVNLQLKDLFMSLNLHGKTDEEIYRIAPTIAFNFALIDELNRIPGVLQNQFLNIVDGYIEIRGKKVYLGNGNFIFAVATGNPPTNGEYTGGFDEDIALLDRIPLIINVDEVEHAPGDVGRIMAADVEKSRIDRGDMTPDVIASYRYLSDSRRGDSAAVATIALFSEFLYPLFRYVDIDGKKVDKSQNDGWRESLLGQHSGGSAISYVSEVSIRRLKAAARLGYALYSIANTESELMKKADMHCEPVEFVDFLDAAFDALKLGLTYDRRFIPADLPKRLDKSHAEMLEAVFSDVTGAFDEVLFQELSIVVAEFLEAVRSGDSAMADKILGMVSKTVEEHPTNKAAYDLMDAIARKEDERNRNALLRKAALEGDGSPGDGVATSRSRVV